MDSNTGRLREGPIASATTYESTAAVPAARPQMTTGMEGQQTGGQSGMPPMEANRSDMTNNTQNPEVGGGPGDFKMMQSNTGSVAGEQNFAMGPGPVPGSAGGFQGPGKAAAVGGPVVGAGFGPGAVNATGGAKGDYDPLENSNRVPMG